MSYSMDPAFDDRRFTVAAEAAVDERAAFISKTYLHLFGAILFFTLLCGVILNTPAIYEPILSVLSLGRWSWLIFLGGFMVVSWIARSMADSTTSIHAQYAGLGLYVIAESILFTPLLIVASVMDPNIIPTAALSTGILFLGLTIIVLWTRKDFSFLAPALMIGGLAAMAAIFCAIMFGFSLGIFFTVAMIALAAGYILYDTSNVLHHYRLNQHVAASLALFASVALLFWYVLQFVMSLQGDD